MGYMVDVLIAKPNGPGGAMPRLTYQCYGYPTGTLSYEVRCAVPLHLSQQL